MSILQTTALLASLAASVSAHGYVQGIVADGTYYSGYSPSFQYQNPPPTVIGWSDPEDQSNGFIAPAAYADPDIICHLSATPGGTSAKVPAGGKVELEWTVWPDSHHGPVLDYLAPVSGAWADIDKTTLEFTKISEGGLVDGSSAPGKWASDDLIANNNTWSVTIPTSIAPGKYVLRHEIIALHSAGQENGAQNYPQCINLEITGTGTDSLSTGGTLGTALYKEDDPGILINIYTALSSYTIPGPALYSGAASGSQTAAASSTAAAAKTGSASSVVAASTTAAAVSATSAATYSSVTAPYANNSTPATTPSVVPSTTSAAAVETTPYTTVDVTTTAYTTAIVTSSPTAPAYSAPASVASAAPSEAPSATTSSSVASPTGSTETKWGDLPSKELPAGWTLKDLLDWVAYLTKPSWNKGVHARDFKRFAAKML